MKVNLKRVREREERERERDLDVRRNGGESRVKEEKAGVTYSQICGQMLGSMGRRRVSHPRHLVL